MFRFLRRQAAHLCALVAVFFSLPALAVCSGGSGLALSDVSFNGQFATACHGAVIGNAKADSVDSLGWGDGWTLLGKDSDKSFASFMGVDFQLDASGHKSGSWSLLSTDANGLEGLNLPMELDLVVVLKASNRYAAYFFDDAVLDGSDGGTWSIAFTNHGGQVPGLSYLGLYVRIDEDGGIPAIPEAHTYALMLVGLGLVGLAARRRARRDA